MTRYRLFLSLFPSIRLTVTGCARFQDRAPKPVNSARRLEQRTLPNPDLLNFIATVVGKEAASAIKTWNWDRLTLAALYYPPDPAVARAQAETADAAIKTAAQPTNPSIALTPTWIYLLIPKIDQPRQEKQYSVNCWPGGKNKDYKNV